jgi:hypothetical protein
VSERLGMPLSRPRRGFAGQVISMSATTFEGLVRSQWINLPNPASIVIEPHLWASTTADAWGEWHAIGRALVLGLLSDTIEFHIWCSNTDSKIPLDPEIERQFVLTYITDELIPLFDSSNVNAAVAELFMDERAPGEPFGS